MQLITFFNVDEHFKRIHNKIIKCIASPTVYLSLHARISDILEIFSHDIESVIPKLYEDINYQRAIKQIKLSDKAFRELMEESFIELFNNYKRVLESIGGGSFLLSTSCKHEIDLFEGQSQRLSNLILEKLFLKSKKDKRTSMNNSLILVCTIIAAITGIISVFSSYY